MSEQDNLQNEGKQKEDYDRPDIEGDIDTVHEEIEYLEKKKKLPVWFWLVLIILISIFALYLTSGQSPTIG